MLKNITLEMSVKPFKQVDDEYVEKVCRQVFEDWKPLVKDVECVSIMLWTADGSEILEYKGNMDEEFEWAKWIGGANPWKEYEHKDDPNKIGLHSSRYLYIENPPVFTYGVLKKIVSTIKRIGKEIFPNKTIRVGETFDIGPEFAESPFKYERHNEICKGQSMGPNCMICAHTFLHADDVAYAGFPNGIEEGLPFGTFFGRQCQIFLTDMGFDYIWFSNGLGFGSEPWSSTGEIFDGNDFRIENFEKVKKLAFEFWGYFRAECDFPIETRGTNNTMGIDLASDGIPLKDIYENYDFLPPPNSPWAALDDNFGLEIAGYMSRIAKIPSDKYLFRFYLHDPWWMNSPWYDRYNSMPHDIYLPLACCRIDEKGAVHNPTHFNILTIDNTLGDMPSACVNESIPHMLKGLKECPDRPSPVVWAYPFNEYSEVKTKEEVAQIYADEWFMVSCINQGFPLSSVVSTDNFIKIDKSIFANSVIVTPVPKANSDFEKSIIDYIKNGGKVIFYGSAHLASKTWLDFTNITLGEEIDGECEYVLNKTVQKPIKIGKLECGGLVREESKNAFATANGKAIGVEGENFCFVRNVLSNEFKRWSRLPRERDATKYSKVEDLMRIALAKFGCDIKVDNAEGAKSPVYMVHRHNGAYIFSIFSAHTTAKTSLRFPLGIPVLDGYTAVINNGYGEYHFPKCERKECRVFVEQEGGIVSVKENAPVSNFDRRKIRVTGLKNATVRILAEDYCKENLRVTLNTPSFDSNVLSDPFEGEYKKIGNDIYYEVKNASGMLLITFPYPNGCASKIKG
ncbi:MAG: hypothetical protein J6C23_02060 [Clostridia bacterium]|nr:hypothetical protein [Clostridia bacterium]